MDQVNFLLSFIFFLVLFVELAKPMLVQIQVGPIKCEPLNCSVAPQCETLGVHAIIVQVLL